MTATSSRRLADPRDQCARTRREATIAPADHLSWAATTTNPTRPGRHDWRAVGWHLRPRSEPADQCLGAFVEPWYLAASHPADHHRSPSRLPGRSASGAELAGRRSYSCCCRAAPGNGGSRRLGNAGGPQCADRGDLAGPGPARHRLRIDTEECSYSPGQERVRLRVFCHDISLSFQVSASCSR